MKRVLALPGLLLILVVPALAQPPYRMHSQATPPPREVLDRLSLTLAWRLKVPVNGVRDGLTSVQLAPGVGGRNDTLFVQTYAGNIFALDAENGKLLWRVHVGQSYQPSQPLGFNSTTVFAVRREKLFVLDRETGEHLVYKLHANSKEPLLGFDLEEVPSTGLVAAEDFLYVCMDHRVSAYEIPNFRRLAELLARQAKSNNETIRPFAMDSPQPRRDWSKLLVQLSVHLMPRLTDDFVALACTDGTFLTMVAGADGGQEAFRYKTQGAFHGALGQHGTMMYIGSEDYHLYAFDISRAQVKWRFPGASPIQSPAEVTDRDVFVVPERSGLTRVDRELGKGLWSNKAARRFLCTNFKYVYANDAHGKLLVLDYERGTELARWDASAFNMPVSNDRTDRLFLANHDGQLVCLHHRDLVKPLLVRTVKQFVKKEPPVKDKDKEKDKEKEKEKDKGKEMEKDKGKEKGGDFPPGFGLLPREERPQLVRREARPEWWAIGRLDR
jgi:outer membrane protein assembly factor BamB